jgi:hypothetical protein
VPIISGIVWAVFLERREGKNHVFGRHRRAVVPLRFGAQPVGRRGKIVRVADAFGKQPVSGRHFVERRRQQPVVDQPDAAGEVAFDVGDRDIEIVESADGDFAHRAAFRRVGVDVIELLEAFRVFQVTKQRQAVAPFSVLIPVLRLRGSQPGRQRQSRRGQGKRGGFQQGSAIQVALQFGAPINVVRNRGNQRR